jgi:hypothetical protein
MPALPLILLFCGSVSWSLPAATISGTLKTTAGKPIRAALTIHDLSTARTSTQTPFDHQFATKSDGTFSLTNIPAGKYEFCVEAPQENVLDPCIWTPGGAPAFTVAAASSAIVNHAITVDIGYNLQLRVNDPASLVPVTKSGVSGDVLSLKVITAANRVLNFRLLSSDSQGRNHYLLIPFNQTLFVVTQSSSLALSSGATVNAPGTAQRIPVRVPLGGTWPVITLGVAASAAPAPVSNGANAIKP